LDDIDKLKKELDKYEMLSTNYKLDTNLRAIIFNEYKKLYPTFTEIDMINIEFSMMQIVNSKKNKYKINHINYYSNM